MVTHIVFWKLKPEGAAGLSLVGAAEKMKTDLEALAGKIPGLLSIRVGIDISKTAQSADVALLTTFPDQAALDLYQNHPLHVACKAFIGQAAMARQVVDFVG